VTQGCTEAANLALRAVTQSGDTTVAVESPTFYGLLQIIEALGLRTIELPTSPRGVPLIEADIYGEMHDQPRRPLKSWDGSGNVIHCNSLNKILVPGLRLGWMLAGRWQARVEMLKYTQSRFPEELPQSVAAEFLASLRTTATCAGFM
jgi:DNA-binding transcriptional MocR family regulator